MAVVNEMVIDNQQVNFLRMGLNEIAQSDWFIVFSIA